MSDSVSKVKEDFESLVSGYREILQLCYDALAPGKSQSDRNQMREALSAYLKNDS